jgi:formylmethanofuran dehydrogenase subunit E
LEERSDKAKEKPVVCPTCGASIKTDDREAYNEKGMCGECNRTLSVED